jgi:hypothetical protein
MPWWAWPFFLIGCIAVVAAIAWIVLWIRGMRSMSNIDV